MKRTNYLVILIALFALITIAADSNLGEQNWTHFVRIGAYGLRSDNADKIVRNAQESNVFGIEVDNDVTGRYESFVNPEAKLQAIRTLSP